MTKILLLFVAISMVIQNSEGSNIIGENLSLEIPILVVDVDTNDSKTVDFQLWGNMFIEAQVQDFCMKYNLDFGACQYLGSLSRLKLWEKSNDDLNRSKASSYNLLLVIARPSDVLFLELLVRRIKNIYFSADITTTLVYLSNNNDHKINVLLKSLKFSPDIELSFKDSEDSSDSQALIDHITDFEKIIKANNYDMVLVSGNSCLAAGASITASINNLPVIYIPPPTISSITTQEKYYKFQTLFQDVTITNSRFHQKLISSLSSYIFINHKNDLFYTEYLVPFPKSSLSFKQPHNYPSKVQVIGSLAIDSMIRALSETRFRPSEDTLNLYQTYDIQHNSSNIIIFLPSLFSNISDYNTLSSSSSSSSIEEILEQLLQFTTNNSNINLLLIDIPPAAESSIALQELSLLPHVHFLSFLPLQPFLFLLDNCYLVVTDSVTVIQQSTFLGVPCLYPHPSKHSENPPSFPLQLHNNTIAVTMEDMAPMLHILFSTNKRSFYLSMFLERYAESALKQGSLEEHRAYTANGGDSILSTCSKELFDLSVHSTELGDGWSAQRAACQLVALLDKNTSDALCNDRSLGEDYDGRAQDAYRFAIKMNPHLIPQRHRDGRSLDVPIDDPCALATTDHGPLLDRIVIHDSEDTSNTSLSSTRIFCGIYTTATRHDTVAKLIRDTWGKRCDGWMAFSTTNDFTIPAVEVPHEGEESYQNMWQKVRAIWKYVWLHFSQDFDWFLMGGDDLYVIVDNLRHYLKSPEVKRLQRSKRGVYLGRHLYRKVMRLPEFVFNTGESGYVMDNIALKNLIGNIDRRVCRAHEKVSWEDVHVGLCLLEGANIRAEDTRDNSGRQIFHFTTPADMWLKPPPDRYFRNESDARVLGFNCCSPHSVTFHNVKADLMVALDAYLYRCKNRKSGMKTIFEYDGDSKNDEIIFPADMEILEISQIY